MGKLYAFCLHSSALSAFVCIDFGAKSLKLREWYGFEVRGATSYVSISVQRHIFIMQNFL